MRVVIATGNGRYADPWHPFDATSRAVASVLSDAGAQVRINDDLDATMRDLDAVDLLIVNAGDPWRHGGTPTAVPPESLRGLNNALVGGIGILALHASVASLRDYPSWAPAIGAVWIPEVSTHPPAGRSRIRLSTHELTTGLDDFDVIDERYCFLQMLGKHATAAEHEHDGDRFPTVWTRHYGRARIACSLLGHNEESYESAGHQELLRRLASWAGRYSEKQPPSDAVLTAQNITAAPHGDVTLEDVARASGLSPTTASRVLNGSARTVGDHYRERVIAAAELLGYRANSAAQAMAHAARRPAG